MNLNRRLWGAEIVEKWETAGSFILEQKDTKKR